MKPNDRQKVCPQCDGRIGIDAKECIYCGAEQFRSSPGLPSPSFKPAFSQDSSAPLYPPLYPSKSSSAVGEEPETPSKFHQASPPSSQEVFNKSVHKVEEDSAHDAKSDFYLMLFVLSGTTILTLGLLQFFFSQEGSLQLEWNSRYWFVYCLASFPFFYLGFKKMKVG